MIHGYQYLIVLEDDICLTPDFSKRLFEGIAAAGQLWDLLYLGRLPQEPTAAASTASPSLATATAATATC